MNLLKISLVISIIGIIILLFLSNILSPEQIEIGKINNKYINQKVNVNGKIFNIKKYEDSNFQVISIKDSTGKIDITIDEIINFKINQTINIIGTVQEYKQYLQIQADKIKT